MEPCIPKMPVCCILASSTKISAFTGKIGAVHLGFQRPNDRGEQTDFGLLAPSALAAKA